MPRLLLVLLLTCTAASATGSNHTAAAGEGEAGAYGEGGTAPQGVSPVAAIHVQQDVFGQDDAGFAIAFNGLNDIAALRSGVFNLTDPGTAGLERAALQLALEPVMSRGGNHGAQHRAGQ